MLASVIRFICGHMGQGSRRDAFISCRHMLCGVRGRNFMELAGGLVASPCNSEFYPLPPTGTLQKRS